MFTTGGTGREEGGGAMFTTGRTGREEGGGAMCTTGGTGTGRSVSPDGWEVNEPVAEPVMFDPELPLLTEKERGDCRRQCGGKKRKRKNRGREKREKEKSKVNEEARRGRQRRGTDVSGGDRGVCAKKPGVPRCIAEIDAVRNIIK